MRAGLDASTVTPGSTAPEVSRTTPAMALVPCALASADAKSTHAQTAVGRSVKAATLDGARYKTRRRMFMVLPKDLIVSPFACTDLCPHGGRLTLLRQFVGEVPALPAVRGVDHECVSLPMSGLSATDAPVMPPTLAGLSDFHPGVEPTIYTRRDAKSITNSLSSLAPLQARRRRVRRHGCGARWDNRSQQRSTQHEESDREIDDEAGHINEGGDKRCG